MDPEANIIVGSTLDPDVEGALSLIDAESDERLDLELGRQAIEGYKERLTRLRDSVRRATLAAGGVYACVAAAEPAAMFRNGLLPQGIVEPA